ncbi:ankyrin-1-like [Trichogramma pretiosum]|uniref:ankyrin-1-like n=1 Tax=Trichogramma pretiosum TaxID=7493 RepID=UPI000C71A4E3|nr:ankyrin-1-like [Trichogramma pretiosum]
MCVTMVSKKVHVSNDDANFEKLMLRKNIDWRNEKERDDLYNGLCKYIPSREGQLPELRDIFSRVEIDWLLTMDVKNSRKSLRRKAPIIDWAIRTGYKDEPDRDKYGKPWSHGTTPVHHAASSFYLWPCDECENADAVRDYLKIVDSLFQIYDRFDVNYTDESGFTHLHAACKSGNYEVVKRFLENGQDPNCIALEENDKTPLHAAVAWGHKKITELLLTKGANPNAANAKGMTPLHIIGMRRVDDDLAEVFLRTCDKINSKVRVNARDKSLNTPLLLAMLWSNNKTFETILRYGGNPNLVNENKETLLHLICKDRRNYTADIKKKLKVANLVRILFKTCHDVGKNVLVNAQDQLGNTPLHEALNNGLSSTVELLLKVGSDPCVVNAEGLTPLHIACESDYFGGHAIDKFFELIGQNRVRVDVRDKFGNTPLHVAFDKKNEKMVVNLLKLGFDPYVANAEGSTPLQIACKNGYFGTVSIDEFSKLSAIHEARHVNAPDKSGKTPLHHTLDSLVDALLSNRLGDYRRFKDALVFLLNRGADPNLANQNKETLLHLICKNRRNLIADDEKKLELANLVRILFKTCHDVGKKVLVNAQDKRGNTPLHEALNNCMSSTVEVLLSSGANPNIANREKFTPLHFLCMKPDDVMFTFTLFEAYCHNEYHPLQVNAQEKSGDTPLHFALEKKCPHLVRWLMRNGSDPGIANAEGLTPLHTACKNYFFGGFSIHEFFTLGAHQIRINAQDELGNTPLHYAVEYILFQALVLRGTVQSGVKDVVEFLLKNGADPHLANKKKQTPLQRISQYQCDGKISSEVLSWATMLVETSDEKNQPLQVNAQDDEGNTPLCKTLWNTPRKRCGSDGEFGQDQGIDSFAHYLPKRQKDGLVNVFLRINNNLNQRMQVDAVDKLDRKPLWAIQS